MREKLIELLKDTRANAAWHRWGYEEAADYLIANGVTLDNQVSSSKWIPSGERLPEDRQRVLLFKQAKYGSCVMTAAYSTCLESYCNIDFCGVKRGGFFDYDSEAGYYELRDVTHWMPLPEPPKEEN